MRTALSVAQSAKARAARYQLTLLAGFAILAVYLYNGCSPSIAESNKTLGLIVIALGILPLGAFFDGRGCGPLPLLPAVGLFYAVAFGLPVFLDFQSLSSITWVNGASIPALITVTYALLFLYVGYYASRETIFQNVRPYSLRIPKCDPNVTALWVFMALDIADVYTHWADRIPSSGYVIAAGSSVAYALLFWQYLHKQLPRRKIFPFLGIALPLATIGRILSGSIAEPMMLGLLLLSVYWLAKHQIPWRTLATVIIVLVPLHDAKQRYRELTWFEGEQNSASPLQKLMTFSELALHNSQREEHKEQSKVLGNSLLLRASQLGFLTVVVEQTPSVVSYLDGESYTILIYKLIPRLFWREKPTESMGKDLSSRYGMRAPGDETTSFNVPWIVEMYANFGAVGVATGMALTGVLFAFLDRRFNGRQMNPLDRVFGLVLVLDLVYQESNFSLMVGNKILVFISLALILPLTLRARRRSTRPTMSSERQSPGRNFSTKAISPTS